MNNFAAVILAAGQGTRMKSDKCKVMHDVCGKPLIGWVYDKCVSAGSEKVVMVVGHKKEDVISFMGEDKMYAVQDKRLGTGHAVMCAKEHLSDYDGTVVILCGDTPLISSDTIKKAVEYHASNNMSATVISAVLHDPFGYGRIIKDADGNLLKIVEQKDATDDEKAVCEINSGMYCFNGKDLFDALSKISNKNAQNEYYLTDTIAILKNESKRVGAYVMDDSNEILGVNDRAGLGVAQKIKNREFVNLHMKNGVTVIDPDTTYIYENVKIGIDTVLYPGTILKDGTTIGENCEIGPFTTIEDAEIKDRVCIKNSVVMRTSVESDTSIGPFCYITSDFKADK